MKMIKCKSCGTISYDIDPWIDDYIYDDECQDEISILKCPNCGNDDQEELEIIEE